MTNSKINMMAITNLIKTIKKLPSKDQELIHQIFSLQENKGLIKIPPTFKKNACQYYQTPTTKNPSTILKRISTQKIIRITNKITGEEALFNELRTNPPCINDNRLDIEIFEELIKPQSPCDFCNPITLTSEDTFGRITGKHCVTAANIAKYDEWHSIIIFKKHNPLDFNADEFRDYLKTAEKWFEKVKTITKEKTYPLLIWNCLPRSGSSQIHGHAQILLATDHPYRHSNNLYKQAQKYEQNYQINYFKNLFTILQKLGLAIQKKHLQILANLTPSKERELIILSPKSPYTDTKTQKELWEPLRTYIDKIGVKSFNLSIFSPPDNQKAPYIIKIIDRGPLGKKACDIGAMELYASSVIGHDPYQTIKYFL